MNINLSMQIQKECKKNDSFSLQLLVNLILSLVCKGLVLFYIIIE